MSQTAKSQAVYGGGGRQEWEQQRGAPVCSVRRSLGDRASEYQREASGPKQRLIFKELGCSKEQIGEGPLDHGKPQNPENSEGSWG